MNHYSSPIPRSIFGIAAIALMAGTFGLAVVAPAKLGSASDGALAAAASTQVAKAPIEIGLSPSRIEVIGIREQTTAHDPARYSPPRPKQAS